MRSTGAKPLKLLKQQPRLLLIDVAAKLHADRKTDGDERRD